MDQQREDRLSPPTSAPDADRWGERLLLGFDLGLGALFFLAPLILGGRHPVGQFAFVATIGVMASLWGLRQWRLASTSWRRSGAELLLLAGALLIVVQTIPLTPEVLNFLSPKTAELLPLWQEQGSISTSSPLHLGSWRYLSLTPHATRGGLAMYLAYALLFLVVLQRIQDRQDIERILRWLALAAISMAVLGLAQLLAGNGRFLWFYEHPSRTTLRAAKGAFANQNHFAHFLALGLGPLIWWLQRISRKRPAPRTDFAGKVAISMPTFHFALLSGLGIVGLAGLLTFSRGGIAIMLLAALTTICFLQRQRLLGRRSWTALGAVAAILVAALAIRGAAPLLKKIDSVAGARSLEDLSYSRTHLWMAVGKAAADFWRCGSGVGSHREIYRVYLDEVYNVEMTHAENGYLQVLLETGVGGLLLLLLGIAIGGGWCLRLQRRAPSVEAAACGAALTAGIVASIAHAVCDFAWYIPACMAVTVVLLACACRLAQLEAGTVAKTWRLNRFTRPALAGVLTLLAVCAIHQRVAPALAAPAWDNYLRLSLASNEFRALGDEARERDGPAVDPTSAESLRVMLTHLDQAIARDPANPRFHQRRATLGIRLFNYMQSESDNPMDVNQIRDAALASQFASRKQLFEWLGRAFDNRCQVLDQSLNHALHSLRGNPLQGRAYLSLAQVGFLADPREDFRGPLLQQAVRVRPKDASVLTNVGFELVLMQDVDRATPFLQDAFRCRGGDRERIINVVAPFLPVKKFLEVFAPDNEGLRLLFNHLRATGRLEEMRIVGAQLVLQLQQQAQASPHARALALWKQCHSICRQMDMHPQAAQAARLAVRLSPYDYAARRGLGMSLMKLQQYDEALEHLQWCLGKRPRDDEVRQATRQIRLAQVNRLNAPPAANPLH